MEIQVVRGDITAADVDVLEAWTGSVGATYRPACQVPIVQ
jgi:hypothetical protein